MRYPCAMKRVHPGEVLREKFLVPLSLTVEAFAAAYGLPTDLIAELVAETGTVTHEVGEKLGKALGTTSEFWTNLQHKFDEGKGR
jgi:addiction module HigA family antidote